MKLRPLRGYCLVEQLDNELETKGGFVLPESSKDKPCKGRVLAIGLPPYVGKDDIPYVWEIKVGHEVIFKKWGGQDVDDELKLVGHNELMGVYE